MALRGFPHCFALIFNLAKNSSAYPITGSASNYCEDMFFGINIPLIHYCIIVLLCVRNESWQNKPQSCCHSVLLIYSLILLANTRI